jgi:hypothetical protein
MNVAATAYDLRVRTSRRAPVSARRARAQAEQPATGDFVSRLVDSLAWTFGLDTLERELARLLLCARPLGAIARGLKVSTSSAQRLCQALFVTTGADGREELFELALRLTAMRELNGLVLSGRSARR